MSTQVAGHSIIRLASESDAREIRDIYAPFCESTPISFETVAPDVAEMRQRISSTLAAFPWLVFERGSDGVLGYAYASVHRVRTAYRWSVDVSAYVRPGVRRTGVGRASTPRSSVSYACRASTRRSRESRCPTREVSGCTRRWGLSRLAFTAGSGSNVTRGTMSRGMNCHFALAPPRPRTLCLSRRLARFPAGPRPSLRAHAVYANRGRTRPRRQNGGSTAGLRP